MDADIKKAIGLLEILEIKDKSLTYGWEKFNSKL
jgi:hypothetical protein